jgi:uncharacterized protein
MATESPMIFLNLPVASLEASITFYIALGFVQNKFFSGPCVTMMALPPLTHGAGTINVMLMTHEKFLGFMPNNKVITDAKKSTEVLLCLSCESKAKVDEWLEKAVQAGGKGEVCPKQEMGEHMYGTSFEDLDGHVWEVMWMSEEMVLKAEKEAGNGAEEEGEEKKE